ncbi:Phage integrase family protein [Filomicrobium insigne]|uniref:Phage integrase family protein n=1 Tax=Filomicrobium insigne TaxID=418854 RepID=A0A1H0SB60_9HYPH|nr:site-specific integrase [Filomicrobium insigne]SDP38406.1 Phage integrase family protein [Filomicrobium insigne]
MARELNKLSAVMVKQAIAGKYADGLGLWLVKADRRTGKWVLRVVVHGRRREMGLGSFTDVSLKEARDEAEKWRAVVRSGHDPIKERERQRREQQKNLHTLADVADDCFEAIKATLKGDGSAGRWMSPLTHHVLPKLGKVPVADLDQVDIRNTLRPLRDTKRETMEKALGRLNIIVRHAAALGLDVDIQVVDKAKALIGASQYQPKHIPALPWRDVPTFYASLDDASVTHLALRLLILTGVRSRPLRFLHIDHIDGDVWTVPADLMKSRKGKAEDFRVPLSPGALAVIDKSKRHARDGYLFPSARTGVISDMTMSKFMERRGLEARPHGFRSALRTWLAECTEAPHEIAEACLAHKTGSEVVNAYRRTDYLDERRRLLDRWGHYVTTAKDEGASETEASISNVVPLRVGAGA